MAFIWFLIGLIRRDCSSFARDYRGISHADSANFNWPCIKSSVQCVGITAVCCFASRHEDIILIRYLFLIIAHIPLFLYPFLNTTNKNRPFEYLRLTSLGVIGALVKVGLIINGRTIMPKSLISCSLQRLFHCV